MSLELDELEQLIAQSDLLSSENYNSLFNSSNGLEDVSPSVTFVSLCNFKSPVFIQSLSEFGQLKALLELDAEELQGIESPGLNLTVEEVALFRLFGN